MRNLNTDGRKILKYNIRFKGAVRINLAGVEVRGWGSQEQGCQLRRSMKDEKLFDQPNNCKHGRITLFRSVS